VDGAKQFFETLTTGIVETVLGREPGQADLHEEDERVLDCALPTDDHDQVSPVVSRNIHIFISAIKRVVLVSIILENGVVQHNRINCRSGA
jgi:hypothetical protein